MISEEIINQILDRVDIVDVVSSYIPLKRAGRNFRANCPFHHEKTPSFMVSPDKQIFHCFGCGAGGNVFGFLMKYDRLEFPEAAELLAGKAGIELPKWAPSQTEQSEITKIKSANELASNFYHYTLVKMDVGKDAYAYLKKRGIKDESLKQMKLGYAPTSWDSFLNHAKKKGLDERLLQRAGLVVASKDGTHYDRFRHRVIFPILNQKGQVIGFGARVLDETLPKYINSPETPVYNKGRNLYGLNLAIEDIKQKDSAIIVEGYLDFLTPYQAGIRNIVASLGTALTTEQIKLLKRYTKNIVVVFDPDSAGEAASLRGLDLLIAEGLNVKVATLPDGYDPDKFVSKMGAAKFQDAIDNSRDFFDYKFRLLKSRHPDKSVESKAKIAGEMLLSIARIPNAIARTEYVKRLADNLDVAQEALWLEIKKIKPDKPPDVDARSLARQAPAAASCTGTAEKMLLGLALEEPRMIDEIRKHLLSSAAGEQDDFKILFDAVCDFWDKNKTVNVAKLLNSIKEPQHCQMILDACAMLGGVQDKDKCLKDCIRAIKQAQVGSEMKLLQGQIKAAQENSYNQTHLQELLHRYNNLMRQKAKVQLQ